MTVRGTCLVVASVVTAVSCAAGADSPSFQGLGDLPGDPFYSLASGISGDGSTAVGIGNCQPHGGEAFVWKNGVMTGLGDLPGGALWSVAMAASWDGSVVVGFSQSGHGDEAFRWENGVMSALGFLPNAYPWSAGYGVSAHGTVIVGSSNDRGFRWENGVMTDLGSLAGGWYRSDAYDVSADGWIIVGTWGDASGENQEAYRFEGGVMSGLGDLPGGTFWSRGFGVSPDGSVVVGESTSARGTEAFRWADGVMTGLGALPSEYLFLSCASDVSADGSTVVGSSVTGPGAAAGWRAFIWTGATGMLKLTDVLSALGVDLTGWGLAKATGISDDGLTIVGYGGSPNGHEAWLATLPPNWVHEVTYELTVSISRSDWGVWGTVDMEPNLARYFVGKAVTLTAVPNEGVAFKKWKLYDPNHPGDANHVVTDTNDVLTLVMTADREVVAVFKCAPGGAMAPLLLTTLATLGLFALIRRGAL